MSASEARDGRIAISAPHLTMVMTYVFVVVLVVVGTANGLSGTDLGCILTAAAALTGVLLGRRVHLPRRKRQRQPRTGTV